MANKPLRIIYKNCAACTKKHHHECEIMKLGELDSGEKVRFLCACGHINETYNDW